MGIWTPHYIKENYSCHSLNLIIGINMLKIARHGSVIGYNTEGNRESKVCKRSAYAPPTFSVTAPPTHLVVPVLRRSTACRALFHILISSIKSSSCSLLWTMNDPYHQWLMVSLLLTTPPHILLTPPGLRPGQRKVMFTCFKRNDKREVKVAQLAGSVAEHSGYHHGEVSDCRSNT